MRKTIKMHVSKAMVIACVHGKLGGVFGVTKTVHEMGVMGKMSCPVTESFDIN